MKLSFIVPVVQPELHLQKLLISLRSCCDDVANIELIVVNQSQSPVGHLLSELCISTKEVVTESVIPASVARNLGASHAKGEFLFFLDDDAVLVAEQDQMRRLLDNLTGDVDLGVTHRGELVDRKFKSHWPSDKARIGQSNFSEYTIEWNLIIRASIFQAHGGFPEIGAGSRHAALSGEVFVLIAKILGSGISINRFNYINVAHPALIKPGNSAVNLLGYFYGAGYAAGVSIKNFSLPWAVYWVLRPIFASVADLVFRRRLYRDSLMPKLRRLGFALFTARITGLINGVFGSSIKDKAWLESLVAKYR